VPSRARRWYAPGDIQARGGAVERPEASLQFEQAEPVEAPAGTGPGAGAVRCAGCGAALRSYHQVNGHVACEACRAAAVRAHGASHVPTVLRAAGLGVLAAIAGALLYYGVAKLTGYEIGLVSIAVGLLVGHAVKRGARGRGGWRYQALAVFLCYSGIAASYAPSVFEELGKRREGQEEQAATPQAQPAAPDGAAPEAPLGPGRALLALVALFMFCIALPVLVGLESPMTFVIVGIALWEAWRVNRAAPFQVSGPFEVGPPAAAAPVPADG